MFSFLVSVIALTIIKYYSTYSVGYYSTYSVLYRLVGRLGFSSKG